MKASLGLAAVLLTLLTGCGDDSKSMSDDEPDIIANCPVTAEQLKAATGVDWSAEGIPQRTTYSVLRDVDRESCRFRSRAWGAETITHAVFTAAVVTGKDAGAMNRTFDGNCTEKVEGFEPGKLTKKGTRAFCTDDLGHRSFRYGTDPAHLFVFEFVNPDRIADASAAMTKLATGRK